MKISNQKFIVTGGAGLIGSTIIDQMLEKYPEITIRVLDDFSRGTMHNLETALKSERVEICKVDIRDFDAIRPFFDGVDAVFHQAAIRITRCAQEPRECLEVLFNGTFNVLQACVEANIQKVVAASSASVYGLAEEFPTKEDHHPYDNRTLYGTAKVALEGMLRSFNDMYGLDYIALRYFNVYGPRMDVFGKYTEVLIRWLDLIDQDKSPLIFGDGKQTMDFVYVSDVAMANVASMESDISDEVFNVATCKETSLLELLEALLKCSGKEHIQPTFKEERAVNPVPRRLADVSKARDMLGFEAKVSVEQGLQKLIEWRKSALSNTTNL